VTLRGKHVLVTAGPTHEPIDPVTVVLRESGADACAAVVARQGDAPMSEVIHQCDDVVGHGPFVVTAGGLSVSP